jgi:hypothetical protein
VILRERSQESQDPSPSAAPTGASSMFNFAHI